MEHPLNQFKYCPKCRSAAFEIHNEKSKQCTDCGFVYYFNPSSATVALILNEKDELLVCRRAKEPANARGAAQPIVLNKTEINPEEIVQAAIDDICVELKAKPHSIEVINEASGLTCLGDRGYLENVMKNLIENALKYADDGVKIQIEITRISQGIQIKVKDNGWGIAPKYQKKLFNQYYQVPREALRMRKGYGIGLAYVRHIIRAHGGKIQFKSRENEGSVFTFYIPEK